MDSWWKLGEWSGHRGKELALYHIECPFCGEEGNFELEHRSEKKKPNAAKTLYFDTYKCGSCASFVMVLWSASHDMHAFRVLPWPLGKVAKYPDYWPEAVGRYWMQAKRSIKDESWDAAALMARSALQIALRDQNAEGGNLKKEIDDLSNKGILPKIMQDWAHNVRELGNDSAHPYPNQEPTSLQDANDIVGFMDYLFEYLYALPKKIEDYRARKDS